MADRREFLKQGATAAAALAAAAAWKATGGAAIATAAPAPMAREIPDDTSIRELMIAALDAAKSAGAG
jgi:anaerobic selenocysteine-containing dehydrogenase